jgi:glycosyltransferase involved in cell wall biosynthesis
VLTDSEYTAQRLVELVGATRSHIRVVPLGIDPMFLRPIPDAPIAKPYVLFVGNAKRHKNLRTLIAAFARLRKLGLPHELTIAGAVSGIRTDLEALQTLIRERQLMDHVRFLGHVPDADLPGLYRGASLLVLPSLVEGFGLPPLEAMACGTPALVSDRGSLPEVCGDAAEYYTPAEDVDALVRGMVRVLGDASRSEYLVASGRRRAALFTAAECARRTLDALYEA